MVEEISARAEDARHAAAVALIANVAEVVATTDRGRWEASPS